MSPSQDPSSHRRNQPRTKKQKRPRARRPRRRLCLLKGCGNRFRPMYAMSRYCSEECRRKARQWSQWKSRQQWRQSKTGRKKRQEQSARRRERLRIGGNPASVGDSARGSSQARSPKKISAAPVIVQAATRASHGIGVRRCNDSVVTTAGAL
jgi:hypothetical protein